MNRSKVVPLGAAPGHDGGSSPDSPGTAPTARATATPASGRKSAGKPVGKPAGKPAAQKSSAAKPTAGKPTAAKPAPKSSAAKPGTRTPATKRPATKLARGPQEKRLRERAELSGAIRSGTGSGTRPAEPAPAAAEESSPVPARAFSGRMLALAVILAVVTILLLPSVGTYMDQRAEIAQLQASIAEKQQKQADLKTQIARWDDPAYVKAQARNRINLVMPGEKKYMVIGATGDDSAVEPQSAGDVRTDLPWVDSLWDTVVRSATD
ncbi:septum formation initiator family protein [Arthrobacter sp. JSM 101049]|uniref:FtsB family cell division protein n=1 Tax=Arthrobacter sp. JSM 101049 TaxID=929097 RepID=UPI0035641E9A